MMVALGTRLHAILGISQLGISRPLEIRPVPGTNAPVRRLAAPHAKLRGARFALGSSLGQRGRAANLLYIYNFPALVIGAPAPLRVAVHPEDETQSRKLLEGGRVENPLEFIRREWGSALVVRARQVVLSDVALTAEGMFVVLRNRGQKKERETEKVVLWVYVHFVILSDIYFCVYVRQWLYWLRTPWAKVATLAATFLLPL